MPLGTSSRGSAAAILLFLLAGTGCQGHRGARLLYPAPGDPAAAAVPPRAPPDAPAIALQAVTDERPGRREVVGAWERVVSADIPPVARDLVTTDDVAAWVHGALRRELQLAGLNVVGAGPAAGGAPVVVAAVRKLSCRASDRSSSYASWLELRVVLAGRQGPLLDQVYEAKTDLRIQPPGAVTDEGIDACLANTLRDAARKIAADAARVLLGPPSTAAPAAPPGS